MKRILLTFLILGMVFGSAEAQKRKVIKPKPEEEEVVPDTKPSKRANEDTAIRRKLQAPAKKSYTGVTISTFANEFLGFGGHYHYRQDRPLTYAFSLIYYNVPSDQFYFDPYYWQFYQRNRGAIYTLTFGLKYRLPFFEGEPNIRSYAVVGGGPVLGIQYNWNRSFPYSWIHAYSVGGVTAYLGAGIEYYLSAWILAFDIRFQSIYFKKQIFSKQQYNAITFILTFGKTF